MVFYRSPSAAGLLAVALLTASGCQDDATAVRAAATNTSEAAGIPHVKTIQPTVTTLQRTTTQPASVHPFYEAGIHAKVSGYLIELNVDIGDRVAKGDVLAVLDVPEMVKEFEEQQAVILRLQAEEQRAVADVALASANVRAAEAAISQSESDDQKAAADLKAEHREFERTEELVGSRSVEARLLDESRQRLESAEAGKSAAEAALKSARAHVDVSEAQRDSAQAEVARARAATAIARKQLEKMDALLAYASLRAPFDGVVISRNVDPGDLIRNSQSASGDRVALFRVAQVDRVRVRIAIPESDAPWASVGDPATVRIFALQGRPLTGTISRVTRSLEASTRTMLAEIDLDNAQEQLLPGMYGEASIILDEQPDALVLPASAVRFDAAGQARVCTVDSDNVVRIVEVTTGLDDGHQIEIVDGLSRDQRVIDGMLDAPTAGQKVHVDD